MVSIPVIGRVLYQKAALMEMKISAFERGYRKALVGSLEEQEDFIRQMTPVLDDFYAKYSKKSESPKL